MHNTNKSYNKIETKQNKTKQNKTNETQEMKSRWIYCNNNALKNMKQQKHGISKICNDPFLLENSVHPTPLPIGSKESIIFNFESKTHRKKVNRTVVYSKSKHFIFNDNNINFPKNSQNCYKYAYVKQINYNFKLICNDNSNNNDHCANVGFTATRSQGSHRKQLFPKGLFFYCFKKQVSQKKKLWFFVL